MRQALHTAFAGFVLAVASFAWFIPRARAAFEFGPAQDAAAAASAAYKPAEVTQAGDVYRYYEFIADGFFVLRVRLDADGNVVRVTALRDPGGSMVSSAISQIKSWKFSGATVNGDSQPSEMTVVFVYPPRVVGTPALGTFRPVIPEPKLNPAPRHNGGHRDPERSGFAPAGILAVAYCSVPVNIAPPASVVAELSLDVTGQITDTRVLYGKPPFVDLALDAFKKWQFQPATLDGKSLPSSVVIAYVFPLPAITND